MYITKSMTTNTIPALIDRFSGISTNISNKDMNVLIAPSIFRNLALILLSKNFTFIIFKVITSPNKFKQTILYEYTMNNQ